MTYLDLSTLLKPFEDFLHLRILNGKFWKIKILIFSLLLSFSLLLFLNRGYVTQNFKNFYLDTVLHKPQSFFFWKSIVEQGQKPFTPGNHAYGSHESNRTFRLTIPLISRFLHIQGLGLFILQILLGIGFIYLLICIFSKMLIDKILTFYSTLAFLNVYTGSCFFLNCFGHGDGYTFFFMICSLLLTNPLLLSLSIQLSFWSDERSVITVLGVLIFHYFYRRLNTSSSVKLLIIIFINVLTYVGLRLYLTNVYHLQAADVENSTTNRFLEIAQSISTWWGARIYLGFEGFLASTLIIFVILFVQKKYLYFYVSLFYWIPILVVTLLVADTVRTISFTFVFWLVSLFYLKEIIHYKQLKFLIIIIAFTNLLIPIIFP